MGFYQPKLWFNVILMGFYKNQNGDLMGFYQPNGDLMGFQWYFTNKNCDLMWFWIAFYKPKLWFNGILIRF